jgi:hypothetical protein
MNEELNSAIEDGTDDYTAWEMLRKIRVLAGKRRCAAARTVGRDA